MDLQTRKLTFIQEFLCIQNEDIISGLEELLKNRKADLYRAHPQPMSVKQFNADIDRSLEDSENDRVISARDLQAEIKKWN